MKKNKTDSRFHYKFNDIKLSKLFLGLLIVLISGLIFIANGKNRITDNPSVNEWSTDDNHGVDGKPEYFSPTSAWFNNSENPIYIDAEASGVDAHNWTWARNQDWCRVGDGTQGNPYLIENISIDCSGSGSGIYINNSHDIYFTIRNCSITDAAADFYNSGITLEKH